MIPYTMRDLITGSLRLIGVAARGQTPSAYDMQNGLLALNEILNSYNVDMNMLYAQELKTFAITEQKEMYTLGPDLTGGVSPPDWIVPVRPQNLIWAAYQPTSVNPAIDLPLKIVQAVEYAQIRAKTIGSGVPSVLYLDYTFPVGNAYLWTEPNQGGNIVLTYPALLNDTLTLDNVISTGFPPGFFMAMRWELARNLAPEYGKAMPADLSAVAMEVKRKIAINNIESPYSKYDVPNGSGGAYDAVTDTHWS